MSNPPPASALGRDLVPIISADPGSTATGITVRSGGVLIAACLVLNNEKGATRHAPGCDPANGYARRVEAKMRELAAQFSDIARHWYATNGTPVPANVCPWLFGVEKVNPARKARTKAEADTFDETEVAEESTFAANAVANWLLAAFDGRVIWVKPFHADNRWEARFDNGTGDPRDFFPADLLAPIIPADTDPARIFPDGFLDWGAHRVSRVKDVCAAWSVGCDAAEAYQAKCRALYGRVLPPHAAAGAIEAASPSPVNETKQSPSVVEWDLTAQESPAEARYRYARARVTKMGAVQPNPQDYLRDLQVVADYEGKPLDYLLGVWREWALNGLDVNNLPLTLSQPEVNWLRFTNLVLNAAQREAA